MPARLEDLIRLRDGLRALGPVDPPPGSWQRIAARLDAGDVVGEAGIAGARPRVPLMAAAAVAAVAALAGALAVVPWPWAADGPRAVAAAAPLPELVARSRQLESVLQSLPERPAVELVASTATIDALESHLQWIDAELAGDPPGGRARELWQSRVQLLDSLVGVRYAEAVRAGHPLLASSIGQGVSL